MKGKFLMTVTPETTIRNIKVVSYPIRDLEPVEGAAR